MEKAYDLKNLGERLKAQGLPLAQDTLEKMAGILYTEMKAWAKESAALSENKIDDVMAPFYDYMDPIVLPQIDKIKP